VHFSPLTKLFSFPFLFVLQFLLMHFFRQKLMKNTYNMSVTIAYYYYYYYYYYFYSKWNIRCAGIMDNHDQTRGDRFTYRWCWFINMWKPEIVSDNGRIFCLYKRTRTIIFRRFTYMILFTRTCSFIQQ